MGILPWKAILPMKRLLLGTLLCGFVLCIAGSAKARQQAGDIVGVDLPPVAASPIDTRAFPVQIDTRLAVKPPRPANPVEPPDFVFVKNNLPVGGMIDVTRQLGTARFPGMGATGWNPPDPDIAVGLNHVVEVANSSIAIFDRAGTKMFQQTGATFFAGVAGVAYIFDPKVIYDRVHNRFVVVFLEEDDLTQISKLLVAVSDDGDPNGIWYRYRVEAKLVLSATTSAWLDYPGLGYNKDAFVVSGNMFGFVTGLYGSQFIIMPSAPMLTGAAMTPKSLRDTATTNVQMAEVIDPLRAVLFGAARTSTTGVKLIGIRNPATAPVLSSVTLTVPSNASPLIGATTTGLQTLDAMDGRLFNVVWRGGRLVTAHTHSLNGLNALRWYEIGTSTWPESGLPSVSQSGNVSSTSMHYITPAINVNAEGSISLLFTGSNSTTTANVMVASRTATDPVGAMGQPTALSTSLSTTYTLGRWGDYFGVDVDPVDDLSFWGVGSTISAANTWSTAVVGWSVVASPAPKVSITSPAAGATFATGTAVTLAGSASDPQDGVLTASLQWTSSLQGALGTGGSVLVSNLVAGTHVITASVTDSSGLSGSAQRTITVQAPSVAAPSGLGVSKFSATAARLTWVDNSNNETAFEFQRETLSGKIWINQITFTSAANTTSTTDTVPKGSFRYRIRSVNASAASAWSAWVNSPKF